MSSLRSLLLLIVVVFAYGSLAPSELVAQTVRRSTVGKFDAVNQGTLACTQISEGIWEDVPGTVYTFIQGGQSPDELLVNFEAHWDLFTIPGPGDITHLRLVIDDVPQPTPRNIVGHDGIVSGAIFVSRAVEPGSHVARMQWTTENGNGVCSTNRLLVIHHR